MSSLRVNLGPRSYDIAFGQGLLAGAAEFFEARTKANHLLLITDDNVEERYAIPLADACTKQGFEADVLVVAPGEQTKCADIAAQLWQTMIDEGCDRQTAVVAVGGGVVGDLAGFVAATFARGSTSFRCRRRCSHRSIAASAARWGSTSSAPRIWSAPSGNRKAC